MVLTLEEEQNILNNIMDSTEIPEPNIINETSNFVVITYWWGRGNQNNNLARPCPSFYEIFIQTLYKTFTPLLIQIYTRLLSNNTSIKPEARALQLYYFTLAMSFKLSSNPTTPLAANQFSKIIDRVVNKAADDYMDSKYDYCKIDTHPIASSKIKDKFHDNFPDYFRERDNTTKIVLQEINNQRPGIIPQSSIDNYIDKDKARTLLKKFAYDLLATKDVALNIISLCKLIFQKQKLKSEVTNVLNIVKYDELNEEYERYAMAIGNAQSALMNKLDKDSIDKINEILYDKGTTLDIKLINSKFDIQNHIDKINTIKELINFQDFDPELGIEGKIKEVDNIEYNFDKPMKDINKQLYNIATRNNEKFNLLKEQLKFVNTITYDQMINLWEMSCRQNNCNYLAVEYSQFTEPYMKDGVRHMLYQLAINGKPMFIRKALETCKGRSVLYIDGDMFIRHYPMLFDLKDVDFMARGWNCDPRNKNFLESVLYDPYSFETSGGTMFFANTIQAINLLNLWHDESSKKYNQGKADDRILSMIFNAKQLLLKMTIIQLPQEYLWLSITSDPVFLQDIYTPPIGNRNSLQAQEFMEDWLYGEPLTGNDTEGKFQYYFGNPQRKTLEDNIFIEHPECLTSEESAADSGASSDRQPSVYKFIDDHFMVPSFNEDFFEYINFPNPIMAQTLKIWLKFMNDKYFGIYITDYTYHLREFFGEDAAHIDWEDPESVRQLGIKLLNVTSYEKKYGNYNDIYLENITNIPNTSSEPSVYDTGYDNIFFIGYNTPNMIPLICNKLINGISVIYCPDTYTDINKLVKICQGYNNITDIAFEPIWSGEKDIDVSMPFQSFFKPNINTSSPIIFNAYGDMNSYSWADIDAQRIEEYNTIANRDINNNYPQCNRILIDHLMMFNNLIVLSNFLNYGSYTFMSRIRIDYLSKKILNTPTSNTSHTDYTEPATSYTLSPPPSPPTIPNDTVVFQAPKSIVMERKGGGRSRKKNKKKTYKYIKKLGKRRKTIKNKNKAKRTKRR